MINPCIDCLPPDRQPGCQCHCFAGLVYKAWKDERKERAKTERKKEMDFAICKKDRIYATKKKVGLI